MVGPFSFFFLGQVALKVWGSVPQKWSVRPSDHQIPFVYLRSTIYDASRLSYSWIELNRNEIPYIRYSSNQGIDTNNDLLREGEENV